MLICLWYFTILCLWAMCAVLCLCWHHSLCATFSKGMQITDFSVHGYFPGLWTSPDLQDPVSQMWQDITWKFFNPSECLRRSLHNTQENNLFFLLCIWDFLPWCKSPIILVLVLTMFLDRERILLLLNMEDTISTNKENRKEKKKFYYFNMQKNILFLVL